MNIFRIGVLVMVLAFAIPQAGVLGQLEKNKTTQKVKAGSGGEDQDQDQDKDEAEEIDDDNGDAEDDSKKNKKKNGYDKFVAEDAERLEGMFDIIIIKKDYYFEISDEMLGKDMLIGERIAELSNSSKVAAGEMRKAPIMIRFSRDDENVYMHKIVNAYVADEDDPVSIAVNRTSLDPILNTFSIEAFNEDSSAAVIDVTKFFSEEIKEVSPFNAKYKAGKLEAAPTHIVEALSFPENMEVRTYMSYSNTTGDPFSVLVHRSILLLPEESMQPRYEDRRIGYFSNGMTEFSTDTIGVRGMKFINRFDIRPKAEDWDKYLAGELVEPAKPIVFYIDDAFPEEWRTYIKAGVESWQGPFEAIGFKNAIVAKDYPKDDPNFHPEDIRYSCVRYISLPKANSMGPRWIDPRSGEVIGGDMLWWHNVVELLRDWRFVQTAAADPKARERNPGLDIMGPMIQYVAAHELGHVLGLKHNMRASYAFPVDSLRSPSFTSKYGTTPSIMDYARFNYVAQPGDGVEYFLPPIMGAYDYYAIAWGYTPIPEAKSADEEYETLNSWILEKAGDPVYWYGDQQMGAPNLDPSSQNEAVGDDAILASEYGVKNLKFIMDHLGEWCIYENEDFDYLAHMYKEVLKQYERYMGHVVSYIGGVYIYKPVGGEPETYYTPVSEAKQREALNWLFDELYEQASWLLNEDVERVMASKRLDLMKAQAETLDKIMNASILQRLFMYHSEYTCNEFLNDIHTRIWEKTVKKQDLDDFEKHLQISYVRNLLSIPTAVKHPFLSSKLGGELSTPSSSKTSAATNIIDPVLYRKIEDTKVLLKKAVKTKDEEMKAHYAYMLEMVEE